MFLINILRHSFTVGEYKARQINIQVVYQGLHCALTAKDNIFHKEFEQNQNMKDFSIQVFALDSYAFIVLVFKMVRQWL